MALPRIGGASGFPLGYIPNPPDHRDLGLGRVPLLATAQRTSMNNAIFMGPVLNQGQQGSCTAHAGVADREFLHWQQISRLGGTVAPGKEGMYSPAFLYYKERELDGTLDQGDCGSTGRSSCKVLNHFGCATRADMPYDDGDYSTPPLPGQLTEALKWPTGQYHFSANVDDMKSIIATGYNFRLGFAVDEGFEGIGSDGIWYGAGKVLGYHEVLAYGYDDGVNGGSFLIRNSWGKDWGRSGDFYMSYRMAADPKIVSDAVIQHLGKWS